MSRWIAVGFVILGALHTPPAVGALSSEALSILYGPAAGDETVAIVLRHRGAIFVLVALTCYAAAAIRRWRPFAVVLAAWSMLSFLILYLTAGAPSGPLLRIALADGIGVAVLAPMALALWRRTPWARDDGRSPEPATR